MIKKEQLKNFGITLEDYLAFGNATNSFVIPARILKHYDNIENKEEKQQLIFKVLALSVFQNINNILCQLPEQHIQNTYEEFKNVVSERNAENLRCAVFAELKFRLFNNQFPEFSNPVLWITGGLQKYGEVKNYNEQNGNLLSLLGSLEAKTYLYNSDWSNLSNKENFTEMLRDFIKKEAYNEFKNQIIERLDTIEASLPDLEEGDEIEALNLEIDNLKSLYEGLIQKEQNNNVNLEDFNAFKEFTLQMLETRQEQITKNGLNLIKFQTGDFKELQDDFKNYKINLFDRISELEKTKTDLINHKEIYENHLTEFDKLKNSNNILVGNLDYLASKLETVEDNTNELETDVKALLNVPDMQIITALASGKTPPQDHYTYLSSQSDLLATESKIKKELLEKYTELKTLIENNNNSGVSSDTEEKITELIAKCRNLNDSIENLQNWKKEADRLLNDTENLNSLIDSKLTNYANKTAVATAKSEVLENTGRQINSLNSKITNVEAEIQTNTNKLAQLETALTVNTRADEETLNKFNSINADLAKQYKALTEQIGDKISYTDLNDCLNDTALADSLRGHELEIEKLKNEMANCKTTNFEQNNKQNQLKNELNELRKRVEKLENSNNSGGPSWHEPPRRWGGRP